MASIFDNINLPSFGGSQPSAPGQVPLNPQVQGLLDQGVANASRPTSDFAADTNKNVAAYGNASGRNTQQYAQEDASQGYSTTPAANYKIGLYPPFTSQDYARSAIRFERKIELGMEGHRFYDLTRWGTGAAELNAYAAHELASGYSSMIGAKYKTSMSEVLPIPQAQIDLGQVAGKSVLTQNPGYQ